MNLLKLIEQDLQKLEDCNLEIINEELYKYLKTEWEEIRKRIYNIEKATELNLTIEPNDLYSLKVKYAELSATFDFYMHFKIYSEKNGTEKVAMKQVEKIRIDLEEIASELNEKNYEKILKKFNETIDFYKKMKISFLDHPDIKSIMTSFYYQVYKIERRIERKENSFSKTFLEENWFYFQSLLKEDIREFLSRKNSVEDKKMVERYILNLSKLKEFYKEILDIINVNKYYYMILENMKGISPTYLKEDLQKEVIETDHELSNRMWRWWDANLNITYNKNPNQEELVSKQIKLFSNLESNFASFTKREAIAECYSQIIDFAKKYAVHRFKLNSLLLEKKFINIKFLCEYMIVKKRVCSQVVENIIELRNDLSLLGVDCTYEIDCSLLAQLDKIPSNTIINYIVSTQNLNLLAYILETHPEMIRTLPENELKKLVEITNQLTSDEKRHV